MTHQPMLCRNWVALIPLVVLIWLNTVSCATYKNKVVVVGAGVSGVATASRLVRSGLQDVVVLEGMARIGGRVNYQKLANNKGGVDLGAHWVHGKNAVYNLAAPLGLLQSSGDYDNTQVFFTGGRQPNFDGDSFEDLFEDLMSGEVEPTRQDMNKNYQQFINEKVEQILAPFRMSRSDVDAIKRHVSRSLCSLESCANLADVSMRQMDEFEDADGDDLMEWKNGGMNNIIDLLTGKHPKSPWKGLNLESKIKLSTKVTEIDYTEDQVEVTTANGDKYVADYVVYTPSLNVMKHTHRDVFDPPLPSDKVNVINRLGMDVVDKIYLVFDRPWWPANGTAFGLLHNKAYPTETQRWGEDIVLFLAEHHNPNVLGAWVVGEAAKQMELESDDEVKATAMRVLRRYLPPLYRIPEPIQMIRSRWWNNEFVRGAYSFTHRASDGLDEPRKTLARPLTNRRGKPVVLFAGEATNAIHYSTVHGALETGRREADRVLQLSRQTG